jgi:hypothetical protein
VSCAAGISPLPDEKDGSELHYFRTSVAEGYENSIGAGPGGQRIGWQRAGSALSSGSGAAAAAGPAVAVDGGAYGGGYNAGGVGAGGGGGGGGGTASSGAATFSASATVGSPVFYSAARSEADAVARDHRSVTAVLLNESSSSKLSHSSSIVSPSHGRMAGAEAYGGGGGVGGGGVGSPALGMSSPLSAIPMGHTPAPSYRTSVRS